MPNKTVIPAGATFFFDDGCWVPSLHEGLAKCGWRRVHDRCAADVLVALNPMEPHPLSKLVACLLGGVVGTSMLLRKSLPRGPAVAYHAALRSQRYIWISPAVSQKHPEVIDVIECCKEYAGKLCKWTWRDAEWLANCRVGRRAYAVVSKHELEVVTANVAGGVQTMTVAGFLRSLVKLDRDRCSRGADGGR